MDRPTRIIVIGAGWSGLISAKTYLEIANKLGRTIELQILDNAEGPGGVWAKERLYPGLLANSPSALYEFSDFSMVDADHPKYEVLTGQRVQEYLEAYAKRFDLFNKIRFGVHVSKVTRRVPGEAEGWNVETSTGEHLECEKLIVATGLHSKLKLPSVDSEEYIGTSIHSRFLGRTYQTLLKDPSVRNIVVVGGCKSAIETISLFLSSRTSDHPISVSWVIRPNEQGVPIAYVDPNGKPNFVAVSTTRAFGMFYPSVYNLQSWLYDFLHSGRWWLGKLLVQGYWILLSYIFLSSVGYAKSSNGRKIQPQGSTLFFDIPYISLVFHGSGFLDWLHKDDPNILKVYRAQPVKLTDRRLIVKENGKEVSLSADAVIWCTGWQSSLDFFDEEEAHHLGIPIPTSSKAGNKDKQDFAAVVKSSEQQVVSLLPQLQAIGRSDPFIKERQPLTPFRMTNLMISPELIAADDTSITFGGMIASAETPVSAEIMALWSVAYMERLLPWQQSSVSRPSYEQLLTNTAMMQAFMKRRYGYRAVQAPHVVLEVQTFHDMLMGEMGLETQRKNRNSSWVGWFREWFEPYVPADYKNIVDEFLAKQGFA